MVRFFSGSFHQLSGSTPHAWFTALTSDWKNPSELHSKPTAATTPILPRASITPWSVLAIMR